MLTKLAAVVTVAALTCVPLSLPSLAATAPAAPVTSPSTTVLSAGSLDAVAPPALTADPTAPSGAPAAPVEPVITPAQAAEALDVAERVTDGEAQASDPAPAEALRELYVARDELTGAQDKAAGRLLARPTDGARDPAKLGYDSPATAICGTWICVHSVAVGEDSPPDQAWVQRTLSVMETVYARTVAMGWKPPASDGTRGGNGKLDVYLKDIGRTANYGYCIQESRISSRPARATSYCVLDNDFAARQFGGQDPVKSLMATAAHEFFHAVQFNMDFLEDVWMMESTATWMEERIFDEVNDNRQYLRASQIARPRVPLDRVDLAGRQYGAWVFWEYLSRRYGNKVVLSVWNHASKPGPNSMPALRRVLAKPGFRQVFSDYMAATAYPAKYWPEGAAYRPWRNRTGALAPRRIGKRTTMAPRLDHLTAMPYKVRPGARLNRKSRLQVSVSAKGRKGAAATVLVLRKNGTVTRRTVPIRPSGKGSIRVDFGRGKVREVVVAITNGSSEYNCSRLGPWACNGTPRHDNRTLRVTLTPTR